MNRRVASEAPWAAAPFVNGAHRRGRVIVIGAGIGGLATAIRLAAGGLDVVVVERQAHAGGMVRALRSPLGPVDAGPTMLCARGVFDDLFTCAGDALEAHVTLKRQSRLARNFWPDGSQLDLFDDPDRTASAIASFAGPKAEAEFRRFIETCRALRALLAPPPRPAPTARAIVAHLMRHPRSLTLITQLAPMAGRLNGRFSDRRLAQLFAFQAARLGGSPHRMSALWSMLWPAELGGVWAIEGGMHRLASAMAALATRLGVTFKYQCHVERIDIAAGRAAGVSLAGGLRLEAEAVVFNGNPRALSGGLLGPDCQRAAAPMAKTAPPHSARSYSFAAEVSGPPLLHHNTFFATDRFGEFEDLERGHLPIEPTLRVCAWDRGFAVPPAGSSERIEIIASAPALDTAGQSKERDDLALQRWHEMILQRLDQHDLRFTPNPRRVAISTPQILGHLFPGSRGAIYAPVAGGLRTALGRGQIRTHIPGLYLVGGAYYPGDGMQMAALCAQQAAAAVLSDVRPLAEPRRGISVARRRPHSGKAGATLSR